MERECVAGRPGGAWPQVQPCPRSRQLGNTGKRLPLCVCLSPHLTVGVIMVLASQSSPGSSTEHRCGIGPALGASPGCESGTTGAASPGTDIPVPLKPGTALPGDGRMHGSQGSLLKGDLDHSSDTLPQRACVQSQIRWASVSLL